MFVFDNFSVFLVLDTTTIWSDLPKNATKYQVKEAIETMFKVDVKAVNLINVKGKTKKASRNTMGKRADWKKAYVSIKAGQEINFTGE